MELNTSLKFTSSWSNAFEKAQVKHLQDAVRQDNKLFVFNKELPGRWLGQRTLQQIFPLYTCRPDRAASEAPHATLRSAPATFKYHWLQLSSA